jgi:hypothetical protein
MEITFVPLRGNGHFQWNTAAWFGSVVGSTSWMMVVAGFLLVYHEFGLAAISIGAFLLVNIAGWCMWVGRHQLAPFPALMAILGLLAVTVPLVWFAVSAWASPETLERMNWPSSQTYSIGIPLLVPACMAWFCLLERAAYRAQSGQCASS